MPSIQDSLESSRGLRRLPAHQATSTVDEQLADVRPLFSRIVMPRAEVVLRLRYEPSDKASEVDLAHATEEFVDGRGVLSTVVDGLAPSAARTAPWSAAGVQWSECED